VRHPERQAGHERLRKVAKLARLARVRRFRRALRYGVAAAVEHRSVALPSGIRSVLDIGSHRGQFAVFALAQFPEAHITCVEPHPGPRHVLAKVLRNDRSRVDIMPIAAGAQGQAQDLHIAQADDSSSLLPIGRLHDLAFGAARHRGTIQVDVERIDRVVGSVEEPCLMKIDVQGSELSVLIGADGILPSVTYIIVECSFVELYVGQPLAAEIVSYLHTHGYDLIDMHSVTRARAHRCLQADFVFQRRA
jgi:FkbM family methyltransferase